MGQLTARDVCQISYACRHHRDLQVHDFAVNPAQTGGNFSATLHRALQTDRMKSAFAYLRIPQQRKGRRVLLRHPFLLPHERVCLTDLPKPEDQQLFECPIFRDLDLAPGSGSQRCNRKSCFAGVMVPASGAPAAFRKAQVRQCGWQNVVLGFGYADAVPYQGRAREVPTKGHATWHIWQYICQFVT